MCVSGRLIKVLDVVIKCGVCCERESARGTGCCHSM